MKTLRVSLALLLVTGSLVRAQTPGAAVAAVPADGAPATVIRTPQELEQLLAPIALYPDPLIAIILPAATAPADIVLAARHLREFPNDRSQIEHRAWDESVKSLTNYPDVLKWMDENLQWTKQVGEAFAAQSADVMQAVQRLRAQARAAGTLIDTPQQQVIAEPEAIRIVPAQPDVIYVPYYQPEVVFVDRPVFYSRPWITFGVGVPVGSWLAFECDWHRRTIWVGNRHRPWVGHDWRRPLFLPAPAYSGPHFTRTPEVRQWRPPTPPRATVTIVHHNPLPVARPAPLNVVAPPTFGHRGVIADMHRTPAPAPTPAATAPVPTTQNAQPRTFTPGARRGIANSSTPAPATTPVAPVTTFAPSVAAAPAPQPGPPPIEHRSNPPWTRDPNRESRPHGYSYSRGGGNAIAPTPATVPAPTPAVIAPPAAAPIAPPLNNVVSTPTHWHRAPANAAPNVAVAAPVVRHAAPVAAPPPQVAPAPAPQAQAAPSAPPPSSNANPSPSGNHRGRRVNEN